MKELLNALKPLKIKLTVELCLNFMMLGLAIGLFSDGVLIFISKFIFINLNVVALVCLPIVGLAVSFFVALFKMPSAMAVARVGDSLGFQERFTTAIEVGMRLDESPLSAYVVEDARQKAEEADFHTLYRVKVNPNYSKVCLMVLVATLMVGFIPGGDREQMEAQRRTKQKIENEIKAIDAVNRTVKQKEVNEQIKQLKKQLKEAKTEGEAIKAIHKTQQQLKKISKQSTNKDLAALGEKLAQNEQTKALGENIKNENYSQIAKDTEAARKSIENMSEEQLQVLAEQYKKLASEIVSNDELKDTVQKVSEALQSADVPEIDATLSKLTTTIQDLADENKDIRDAVETLNDALTASSNRIQPNKTENGAQPGANQGQDQGQTQTQTQSQTQAQDEQKQQGQSQQGQSQQGQPQNAGQQGQNGTSDGSGGGGKGGQGRGDAAVENETIYSRPAKDYGTYDAQVKGAEGAGGHTEETKQAGVGAKGESISYDKVYERYKKEALTTLDENDIPYGVKDIVKEYFSSF